MLKFWIYRMGDSQPGIFNAEKTNLERCCFK